MGAVPLGQFALGDIIYVSGHLPLGSAQVRLLNTMAGNKTLTKKEPDFHVLHNCTISHPVSHFYFFPLMPTSILPIAHVATNKPKTVAKITNGFLRPARRG